LRCEFDLVDTEWKCENFLGETGVEGDGLSQLRYALAIYIDSNDTIFIADGRNYRVLQCTDVGVCDVFVEAASGGSEYQLTFLHGITGDSFGNIYVSDKDNHRVQVYDSSGVYLKTYGIFREPYQVDKLRLNQPHGVAIGPDGSILVSEHSGHRLIKMDAEGNQLWAVGQAGVYGDDDDHFGQWWGWDGRQPCC
jgi:DNA-binding beta-propeller fold protein YncE